MFMLCKRMWGGDLQRHSLQTSTLDGGFGTLPGAAAVLPGKECLVVREQGSSVGSRAH